MDVLQYLAERTGPTADSQTCTDSQRAASFSSTAIASSDTQDTRIEPGDFDAIEAEVDDLKKQIRKLRESEDSSQPATQTNAQESLLQNHLSAAERLQKQHEEIENRASNSLKPPKVISLPQADDFPVLGGAATVSKFSHEQLPSRGTSYATAATVARPLCPLAYPKDGRNSVTYIEKSDYTACGTTVSLKGVTQETRRDSMMPTEHTVPADRQQISTEEDDQDVRKTPNQAVKPASSTSRKLLDSPHFARPTVATVRRADETLRRASLSPQSANETSRSKTAMAKTARDLHRGPKRMALPEAWAHNAVLSATDTGELQKDDCHNAEPGVECQSSNDPAALRGTALVDSRAHPRTIKKISSYMSPTKATAQRALVTMGSGSPLSVRLRELALDDFAPTSNPSFGDAMAITDSQKAKMGMASNNSNNKPPPLNRERSVAAVDRSSPIKKSANSRSKTAQTQPSKQDRTSGSPSKIPRIVNLISGRHRGSTNALNVKCASPAIEEELPTVANTTTRRRTSHADILQPILKRLEKEGLRRQLSLASPNNNKGYDTANVDTVDRSLHGTPRIVPNALNIETANKLSAQHMRMATRQSRQSSSGSTATASTTIGISPSSLMPAQHRPPCSERTETALSTLVIPPVTFTPPSLTDKDARTSQTPTLRPTAKEFQPLSKSQTPVQQLGMLAWDGSLNTYPPDEWAKIPKDIQKSIQLLRGWKRSAEQSAYGTYYHSGSPFKTAQQEVLDDMMSASQPPQPVVTNDIYRQAQVGQVLKPLLSPGKAYDQWNVRDTDGHEHPVHFGRAAVPMSPMHHADNCTPRGGPSSNMSPHTPTKEAQDGTPFTQAKTWSVGSNRSFSPWSPSYGWRGGDGKEIRFSGNAPHAEKNPNDPAIMEYYGRSGALYRHGRNFEHKQENAPKFWPRSRRQWAELAGTSDQPCGDMHILSAIEQIAYAPALGWCNDCTINPFQ
nr:hypothetical protein CFP56_66822 [Quercus suber]